MIRFLLNEQPVNTALPPGQTLLDFIRYNQHLKGTKIGCREGDCGACTVLLGTLENGEVTYQSVTSCLVPLGNAAGKHVVTIEGLNLENLSPVQQAIIAENGTQCGFCTVGFVVSLTGCCLQTEAPTLPKTIAAMDGNICRCTGYKSLERAAKTITESLQNRPAQEHLNWLTENHYVPAYFKTVPEKLARLQDQPAEPLPETDAVFVVAGGTDLLVQKPETVRDSSVKLLWQQTTLKGIRKEGNRIFMGGGTTVSELRHSEIMQQTLPQLFKHLKLISSTQIRNLGTVAGNFANASPIGDLTVYFLALNASVFLQKIDGPTREIWLKDLYLGYKTLAKTPDEIITEIAFEIPPAHAFFNFEKVSKRMHLDIASVNAALQVLVENGLISEAFAAAGGVAPVPFFLNQTSEFLKGKPVNLETIRAAAEMLQTEINPISDARGTATYKRLLLRQLFFAHFLTLFPAQFKPADLL